MSDGQLLFDFNEECNLDQWRVVNDGVMGGLSQGTLNLNEKGHAVFAGQVSLDNNGGFTSIRHRFDQKSIKGASQIVLRLKGDGKRYQFRVKSKSNDWHSYIYYFKTSGEWETIVVPLGEMYPTFRGRTLDKPNFPAEELSEISLLIGNKKYERFELTIDDIMIN